MKAKRFSNLPTGFARKDEAEEIGLIYSRINNPNLEVLEDRLAVWDKAEKSLVFASGMAAISTALWAFCRPGGVIVHSEPVYGGTEYLLHNMGLPQFGMHRVGFNCAKKGLPGSPMRLKKRAPSPTKSGTSVDAIHIETPANPTNGLVDIKAARRHAESLMKDGRRPAVIVDNTFLGPLWQTPLDHGADLTVTSLTKYVGGHSDLIAGACSGSAEWTGPVQVMRTILGTMGDPYTGWLLQRSLETLKLRMEASTEGAKKVAAFLRDHEKVDSVWFLDYLPADHADREVYDRQCRAAGSTFSFEIKGGEAEAFKVLNALKLIKLAVSLGGTETLASHPAAMTHSDVPPAERDRLGIKDSLIRISVGVEAPDDLIADLGQALEAL